MVDFEFDSELVECDPLIMEGVEMRVIVYDLSMYGKELDF